MKPKVVFNRKKQQKLFCEKRIQNGQLKKLICQLCHFSIFFSNISWIGPLLSLYIELFDSKDICVAKPIWS